VAVRGWVEVSEMTALDLARRLSGMKLRAAVFTDISKDGTLEGPAVESTRAFAEAIKLPVIASGGVGNVEHVRRLGQSCPPGRVNVEGIIIGRALYTGAVSLPEAVAAAREAHPV
jgi:phosphoribosylformimino-5-aminoimidazole carboxamide ribotide isomerase